MSSAARRVLLVEDDAVLNDAFSLVLAKEGFDVEIAFNGEDALEKLQTSTPDIILLDLLMPVMDGKTFLKNFKNPSKIPIIIFSNLDAKTEVQEALDLGASRFMLKAWATPKDLVQVINSTI